MDAFTILLTKITAAQNEVVLSYHRVRGLYFLAIIFAVTLDILVSQFNGKAYDKRTV